MSRGNRPEQGAAAVRLVDGGARAEVDATPTLPEMPAVQVDEHGKVVQTGAKTIDPRDALSRALERDYLQTLGSLSRVPHALVSLMDIPTGRIGPREAFLVSQIDGMLSIDELLDVSGLPRVEALRVLLRLVQIGYVEID